MEILEYHPFKSIEAKEKYLKMYNEKLKEWPIHSESKIIDTSYGQTFVQISGSSDAPPLVLLTGLGGNSLSWIPQIKELSQQFRTYAVDNICDIGLSVSKRAITGHDNFTAWLDELFTALGLENNINLMGLSYGGWLAGEYALSHHERLRKIVMIMPAIVQPISPEFLAKMAQILVDTENTNNLISWLYKDFLQKDETNLKKMEALMEEQKIAASYFEIKPAIQPRVFEDAELQGIKVPALFVVGENEKTYSAQEAVKRLNSAAPQIKTEIIPNAGHDLMHVQEDLVIGKILEFLSGE
jgi:pimeloyl-ACP methyl ester carboxylesterase